ncbi:MAG: hypothetical protein LBD73_01370 [Deferribacteraceae bacterium]|jgi:hypothetical protein|nr:hypothetical protein [Deferribacteraceae bacterium]
MGKFNLFFAFPAVLPVALFIALFFIESCGKKGDPIPKDALDIPPPIWIEVSLSEDGVLISNSSEHTVLAERAESEIGDLSFPSYRQVAMLTPRNEFLDNSTHQETRYIYRFSTQHKRYDVYSDYVTKIVSYRGRVVIDSIRHSIRGGKLCVNMETSRSVAFVDVKINGQPVEADSRSCYAIPLSSKILFSAVPYSESGTPGIAYSETITVTSDQILLPPQNLRIIRRPSNITLSWDGVDNAIEYIVEADGKVNRIDETVYSHPLTGNNCVRFKLYTRFAKGNSPALNAESCP